MQLGGSSVITLTTLYGYTRFLTGTLDNTSAFSDANILALLNQSQRTLQTRLLAALNYDWKENTLDGTGNGSVALVADDNTYSFPTDMIQVDRVEINYTGESDGYVVADIVPLQGINRAVSNLDTNKSVFGTRNKPVVYIRNGVFYLDPMPDVAVSGGMKVWGNTLVTDLSESTSEPVFAEAFHKYPCLDAAWEWASVNKQDKANDLFQRRELLFQEMVDFYSTRIAVKQPIVQSKKRSMR